MRERPDHPVLIDFIIISHERELLGISQTALNVNSWGGGGGFYVSLCDGILRAPCLVMSNSLHEIGYWLSWRSVQPFHSRAIDLMRKPTDGVDAN